MSAHAASTAKSWRRRFCWRAITPAPMRAEGRRQKAEGRSDSWRARLSGSDFCLLPSAFCLRIDNHDRLRIRRVKPQCFRLRLHGLEARHLVELQLQGLVLGFDVFQRFLEARGFAAQ